MRVRYAGYARAFAHCKPTSIREREAGGKSFLGEGKGAICLATVPISIRDIASLPVKSYTAVFLFRLSSQQRPKTGLGRAGLPRLWRLPGRIRPAVVICGYSDPSHWRNAMDGRKTLPTCPAWNTEAQPRIRTSTNDGFTQTYISSSSRQQLPALLFCHYEFTKLLFQSYFLLSLFKYR